MFFLRRRRKVVRPIHSSSKHYLEKKELTRALVTDRLFHFNQHYQLQWRRVAVRNQRSRWGSCSSLKNLNFNYKILFLPPHLQDYIVVHEMCHLVELNHGKQFWKLVEQVIPHYLQCVHELRVIDRGGGSVVHLEKVRTLYEQGTMIASGVATIAIHKEKGLVI